MTGVTASTQPRRRQSDHMERSLPQRIFFDFSGMAALVAVAIGWGVLSNTVATLKEEQVRQRTEAAERSKRDLALAETLGVMATRLEGLRNDVQQMSAEIRAKGAK